MIADTWYAASAICRIASVAFGPYASDRTGPWAVDDANVVPLPEPAELARLLSRPRRVRWWQPVLFETGGGVR